MRHEVIRINKDHKVRIAHIHHRTRNIPNARNLNRSRHDSRHAHLTLDQVKRIGSLNHMTDTQTAMRPQHYITHPLAACQPRCHTTRAVTRELSLAPVSIKEPQEELAIRLALKKLDAIRTNTGIADA